MDPAVQFSFVTAWHVLRESPTPPVATIDLVRGHEATASYHLDVGRRLPFTGRGTLRGRPWEARGTREGVLDEGRTRIQVRLNAIVEVSGLLAGRSLSLHIQPVYGDERCTGMTCEGQIDSEPYTLDVRLTGLQKQGEYLVGVLEARGYLGETPLAYRYRMTSMGNEILWQGDTALVTLSLTP
jgi:hypothetical protein